MICAIIKYCNEKVVIPRIAHIYPPFDVVDVLMQPPF